MERFETEKFMAEALYPHYIQINNEIWQHLENNDGLWLSDMANIASKLKVDIGEVVFYIKSLTDEENEDPCLLEQVFYKANEKGELVFINSPLDEVSNKVKDLQSPNEIEAALADFGDDIFPCWIVIDQPIKKLANSSFNNPSNALSIVLKGW